jgi:hypothetical protein
MNTALHATVEARRLSLFDGGSLRLLLPLDEGGRHRLVVADSTPDIEKLRRLMDSGPRPSRMTWVSSRLSSTARAPRASTRRRGSR